MLSGSPWAEYVFLPAHALPACQTNAVSRGAGELLLSSTSLQATSRPTPATQTQGVSHQVYPIKVSTQ